MSDSEAKKNVDNAQEYSVEYNKFYSEFIPRVLCTIMHSLDLIQTLVENNGIGERLSLDITKFVEYMDMLQKMHGLVQQIQEKGKLKENKND